MVQYYYQNKWVDKEPVPVKVIQIVKRKSETWLEINRDFDARAGFFVKEEVLIKKE